MPSLRKSLPLPLAPVRHLAYDSSGGETNEDGVHKQRFVEQSAERAERRSAEEADWLRAADGHGEQADRLGGGENRLGGGAGMTPLIERKLVMVMMCQNRKRCVGNGKLARVWSPKFGRFLCSDCDERFEAEGIPTETVRYKERSNHV